jgi:hypothetical protein
MLGKRGAHQEHEATLQAKTEFMQMCAPPALRAPACLSGAAPAFLPRLRPCLLRQHSSTAPRAARG